MKRKYKPTDWKLLGWYLYTFFGLVLFAILVTGCASSSLGTKTREIRIAEALEADCPSGSYKEIQRWGRYKILSVECVVYSKRGI